MTKTKNRPDADRTSEFRQRLRDARGQLLRTVLLTNSEMLELADPEPGALVEDSRRAVTAHLLAFISAMLYFLNLVLTVTVSERSAPAPPEFAEASSSTIESPAIFDRLRSWLALAIVILVVAYGPVLFKLVTNTPMNAPGFRVW